MVLFHLALQESGSHHQRDSEFGFRNSKSGRLFVYVNGRWGEGGGEGTGEGGRKTEYGRQGSGVGGQRTGDGSRGSGGGGRKAEDGGSSLKVKK
jgi:hypothetical protein